jgi:hypothetical protein
MPTTRTLFRALLLAPLGVLPAACDDSTRGPSTGPAPAADAVVYAGPGPGNTDVIRYFGAPLHLGNGLARTYILVDRSDRDRPLELGVTLTEGVMDGLPAAEGPATHPGPTHGHESMTVLLLDLPQQNPTPYRFVQLNWNPNGHEPTAIYGLPHFDFHFYTVPPEVRAAIVPTDPDFAVKAASLPAAQFRPPFYVDNATAVGLPAAAVTVPRMGLHWVDVRSPELQAALGNPGAFQPFTKTFFIGSWDGRFIFGEPMITRAYLLSKQEPGARDQEEILPIPTSAHMQPAGFYPTAYRIAYDSHAHEFRVALTGLTPMK